MATSAWITYTLPHNCLTGRLDQTQLHILKENPKLHSLRFEMHLSTWLHIKKYKWLKTIQQHIEHIDEYTLQHNLAIHTRNKYNWSMCQALSFDPFNLSNASHTSIKEKAIWRRLRRWTACRVYLMQATFLPTYIGTINTFPRGKHTEDLFCHWILIQKLLLQQRLI